MKIFILFLLVVFTLTSCSDDELVPTDQDLGPIIRQTSQNVILSTYRDLALAADRLKVKAQQLENSPSQVGLGAIRQAWIDARSPWEQSEGFLFGPVEQEGLDPSLDSWPVNVVDLDNVLASSMQLTSTFLSQQEGTLKGFHTIEYLIWGEQGNKTIESLNYRELEYLRAACTVLADDANSLYQLWSPEEGNFINEIITAGSGSRLYISQKSALEEMVNALVIIADEVGNGKINDPYVQQDLSLEESRFSSNSKVDFADNMRSVKNIYTNAYQSAPNSSSIANLVAQSDSGLNDMILAMIDVSINAIESIPNTFSEAVFQNASAVQEAQNRVRDLQEILERDLIPFISNL